MAPHSSTVAWKILWWGEPGRLQSMGSLRVRKTEWLHFHFSLSWTGEENGNQLQCSCLENPRDRGVWWAAGYVVAESDKLKRRNSSSSSDLIKKIRDTKGTCHAKMGSIKDRHGMDLTEAEDIKKRWQEYTEKRYKKELHDPDNHDGVFTHLDQTSWYVKSSGP